ncbi:MAG: TIGR03960 family B12-binding radical SAM protein [Desulfotomaculales bacterium]
MVSIEHLLPRVEKPARYVGGELNAVAKDWDKVRIRIAFAFPDAYEVGMSHLGLHILYRAVNDRPDALMERVFAPWPDMEGMMRRERIPLFSLESRRPIRDFDVVAFTLQYELTYANVVNMLDLAGLPLTTDERNERVPLVIAGGPCALNPEPLAEFIDVFFIGEGEEVIHEFVDCFIAAREQGLGRRDLLLKLAAVPGAYVPALYRVTYRNDGSIDSIIPVDKGVPYRVRRRLVQDLDAVPFPTRPVVPYLSPVHDRAVLEVFRGCTRGCRFCQAGMIYRPVRERAPEKLLNLAEELLRTTGYDEISLASLSTVDYSRLRELIRALDARYRPEKVSISLPSLRADAFAVDIARTIQEVRKSTLTFAPEAGTQRLRDVINKQVTEEDLLTAVEAAFKAGWLRVKLYFMIGLPTETDEDIEGIAALARKVLEVGRTCGVPRGRLSVTVSVASFVPKAHTPFQWEPQAALEVLTARQAWLKRHLRGPGLACNWHDARMSFLEAVFARGDRRLGAVLRRAQTRGCRFDGWHEQFRYQAWLDAFTAAGIRPESYAYRRFDYKDILPWEHIDSGVSKTFLATEHARALRGEVTLDCRAGICTGCGVCPALEVEPRVGVGSGGSV